MDCPSRIRAHLLWLRAGVGVRNRLRCWVLILSQGGATMGRTILWDIAETARRQRGAPAIHFANAAISYGDLWQEALGLSQLIGDCIGGAPDVGRPVILLSD